MSFNVRDKALEGALLAVAPLAAGYLAFALTARAHVVDALLAGAACGNPQQDMTWTLLGHCAPCWEAGALAFALTLLAGLAVRTAKVREPGPATA